MIIIGEKLNSSIAKTKAAFEQADTAYFEKLAKKQIDCGADFLDVNAGMFIDDEAEKLLWATQIAAKYGKISVDSVNAEAISFVLQNVTLKEPLINSVTLEQERFKNVSSLAVKYAASVIALPISEAGIPQLAEERAEASRELICKLREAGLKDRQIFVDILVQAVSVEWESAKQSLKTLKILRSEFPNVHLTCGLSNVSFGMPKRAYLNGAMLSAAIASGLDAAIMDVTNNDLFMTVKAAELLAGLDEYGLEYISAYRELEG